MIDTGLIPVFYHADVEIASRIVQACLEGGECKTNMCFGDGMYDTWYCTRMCRTDDDCNTDLPCQRSRLYGELIVDLCIMPRP